MPFDSTSRSQDAAAYNAEIGFVSSEPVDFDYDDEELAARRARAKAQVDSWAAYLQRRKAASIRLEAERKAARAAK